MFYSSRTVYVFSGISDVPKSRFLVVSNPCVLSRSRRGMPLVSRRAKSVDTNQLRAVMLQLFVNAQHLVAGQDITCVIRNFTIISTVLTKSEARMVGLVIPAKLKCAGTDLRTYVLNIKVLNSFVTLAFVMLLTRPFVVKMGMCQSVTQNPQSRL
jgi:hypothetical protein